MSLGTILIIILILILIGALPTWGYSSGWGYGPGGIVGVILIIIGHLEKFLSPIRHESDSVTARGHGRMERAGHGAEGLFRC